METRRKRETRREDTPGVNRIPGEKINQQRRETRR